MFDTTPYTNRSIDWLEGFLEGVLTFAHWKDGCQYVGTTGTLFSEVSIVINGLIAKKRGATVKTQRPSRRTHSKLPRGD
jgi:hypothetical protein